MKRRLCMILATIYTLSLVGCYSPKKRNYAAERFQKIEECLPSGIVDVIPDIQESEDCFRGNNIAVFYADDLSSGTVRYYVTYVSDVEVSHIYNGDIYDVFYKYEVDRFFTDSTFEGNVERYLLTYSPIDLSKSSTYPEIKKDVCYYTGVSQHVMKGNSEITTIEGSHFSVKERTYRLEIDTNLVVDEFLSEAEHFDEMGYGHIGTLEKNNSYIGTYYLASNRFYTRDELIEFENNLNEKSNLLKLK